MKIAGIICEYNPFHKGHAYHIAQTRKILGKDTPVVCVMSGNFVQRGDTAIFDKHTRAAAAVSGGADLVIELPLPWAISSAETFAYGGVSILQNLGCTHISFGSECGDTDALMAAAELLMADETQKRIKKELKEGKTYAKACFDALTGVSPKLGALLEGANNLLGIEYSKAVIKLGGKIQPLTVKRKGAGHDSNCPAEQTASASFIRMLILQGENICEYIPENAAKFFSSKKPVSIYDYEQAILSRLRMMSDADYRKLGSDGEGFAQRFMKYAKTAASIDGLLDGVKTKRYPMSRVRRMLLHAVLGVSPEDAAGEPPYVRVLAANAVGCGVLGSIPKTIPVITKPAAVKTFDDRAQHIFALEAASTDFYTLAVSASGESEWRQSPVII